MSAERHLMQVSSKDFEQYVDGILSCLWGSGISSKGKSSLSQRISEFLGQHSITAVTPEDVNLIIISAINKTFMNPLSYLELFITEDCNLRCHYCFVRNKSDNRMTTKVAFEAIDFFLLESGVNKNLSVLFFGGEPLLEFELIKEIVKYAETVAPSNGKEIHFNVTTNGTLFTEDILEFSRGRISYLISVDGGRTTHDRHRRTLEGEGSYDMITSKLALVKKYQPWVGARMTVYPDTVDMLIENVVHLYSNGFNQLIIAPSYGPRWDEKALATYKEQLHKIAAFYIERKRNKEPFRMTFFENESGDRFCASNTWGCRAGRNGITVSTDGRLYPCSKFLGLSGFNKELYCLGDVFTGITRLDAREEFVSMSTEQFSECINCDAADYCTGGCPANNYNDTGCISKPSPFDCANAKLCKRALQRFDEMEMHYPLTS